MNAARWLLGGLALYFVFTAVSAAETESSFAIGGELFRFDYREFDTDGSLLDKETGPMPGFVANWQTKARHWFVGAEGEIAPGIVDYDGQTQTGTPTRSETRTLLFDARLLGGYRFGPTNRHGHRLYAGAGYHYWYRDILDSTASDGTPVAGLLETYRWAYLLFGTRLTLWQNVKHAIQIDARYRWMLTGTMTVDFRGYGGYDNTTLALATEDGWRLALLWRWSLRANRSLSIEPYVSAWNLGRSDLAALTRNGSSTGDLILEPRSETRNAGIRVRYHYRF